MVYKNTIQDILDKCLIFTKKNFNFSKEENYWRKIRSGNLAEIENTEEIKRMAAVFSVIEEIDKKERVQGHIEELQEKISSYESTTIPIKKRSVLKTIYSSAAAILLPIAIIFSYVFLLKTYEVSTDYQIVSTEKGSTTKIVLEDGTTVWLNAESELKYPSTFKNQEKRIVTLTGEAYFDVARNEKQPFEVYADGYKFKVLGTAFNIKAYPGEDKIETTLEHGKVNVEMLNAERTKVTKELVSLDPKQTIVLYKDIPSEKETEVDNKENISENEAGVLQNTEKKKALLIESEDLSTYLAWKDNMLVFKDIAISEIINDLERKYNIHIQVEDKRIGDFKFTGKFTVETPEQAIKIICVATKIGYEIEKDNVLLKMN